MNLPMFGFSDGLQQEDWFTLATGAAGTGYGAGCYNQAAYLANVAMRQAQIYQKKNYVLGWVSIARDDVRDMMSITVNRLNNYTLVATVVLGAAAGLLTGIDFDRLNGNPPWIGHAFWVNTGLSVLFFSLSVGLAVTGMNSAYINTMRLLTWEIRPENPASYNHDYMKQAQQFERLGVGQLFRLPGLEARFGSDAAPKTARSRPHSRASGQPAVPSDRPTGRPAGDPNAHADRLMGLEGRSSEAEQLPLEEVKPEAEHLAYLARYGHFMRLWQPYVAHSTSFIGLGLVALAQGCSFYSLGMLLTDAWSGTDLTSILMFAIFTFLLIAVFYRPIKHRREFILWLVCGMLFLLGPSACCVAAFCKELPFVRQIFAPASMFFQCAFYAVVFAASLAVESDPREQVKEFITGPAGQQFPEDLAENLARGGSSPDMSASPDGSSTESDQEDEESDLRPRESFGQSSRRSRLRSRKQCQVEEEVAKNAQRNARGSVQLSLLLATGVWACVFVVTLFEQNRSALSLLAPRLEEAAPALPLAWPNPNVRPTALACSGSYVIAANSFRVFRLAADGSVHAEPCVVPSLIVDIAAACDARGCRPLVLMDGPGPARVLDCRSGNTLQLLRNPSAAQRFALGWQGQLVALHGAALVDYTWDDAAGGWAPLWRKGSLEAVDVAFAAPGQLLAMGAGGSVDLWALHPGFEHVAHWRLGGASLALCATNATTLLALNDGGSHLATWRMPLGTGL